MESLNPNSSKTSLLEEDANISTFRRRNKILILFLVLLIISLIIIIASLIATLVPVRTPQQSSVSPLEAFCFVSDKQLCRTTLNPLISNTFVSNPNQIFAIALRTASETLRRVVSSNSALSGNCSESLRVGEDRIRGQVEALRVNPFVESLSDEQWGEMMGTIVAAEEDVEACVDDLDAAAGGGVAAELAGVRVCLKSAEDFLIGYNEALQMYEADNGFDRRVFSENLFGVCLFGSQLLFLFCLFCLLSRRTR